MPVAFPPTVAEREAELVALQSAFDEYIASSRELEEELDAELAKMQEKLAESTAANEALEAQLNNISPQITSLETALTESRQKLSQEQAMRRAAEQAQDESEQRVRELEQTMQSIREECDAVHEELAFKENELEETRLELEVEKQQLENELAAIKAELERANSRLANSLMDEETSDRNRAIEVTDVTGMDSVVSESKDGSIQAAASTASVDEAYVKKLEEELELVTEQLIETEKRLSEAENTVQELERVVLSLESQAKREEDEELIRSLQTEAADRLEAEQKVREELTLVREELGLAKEEIQLQQEELQAAEEDARTAAVRLEEEKAKHRDEVNQLHIKIKEAEVASKTSLGEAALVVSTVHDANEKNQQLREEIDAMERALKNSRLDYQNVLEELDAVNARFDEVREEARREGREQAANIIREEMKIDLEHEIREMKEQLTKLSEENATLRQKVDDAEVALASAKDRQEKQMMMSDGTSADAQSELVKQLQSQLARAKEDLVKKDKEMSSLAAQLDERVARAEEDVGRLENELKAAKSQLAESEAHLIVLRRDKERTALPRSPTSKSDGAALFKAQAVGRGRASTVDREELDQMDDIPQTIPSSRRNRSRSTSPSSVMRLEFRLLEESKKLADLQKEYDALQAQKRMGEVRIKRLEDDLRVLQKELFVNGGETAVVTDMSRLSSLAKGKEIPVYEEEDANRIVDVIKSKDPTRMAEELKTLEKKFNSQRDYNAQLLSKMLHLQGNIQVYCRVRPMTIPEMQRGMRSVVEALSETEVGCFDARTNKWKSFAFDRVWGPDQSQQSVFQDVEPLALSVVDGYNACIFAYGQTGSGKTFTMEGVAHNNQYGISYRTIQKIFRLLNLRAQQQRAAEMFVGSENENEPAEEVAFTFSLELGMLEIYNDEVYDLLATHGASTAEKKQEAIRAGGKASLEIRRSKEGRIEVPNLTKEKVNSIQEVMDLLKRGNANRATASTDMNEHSSRSHMVLVVDVYSGLDGAQRNKGTLYLVDLAGSERVRKSNVEGEQLKEAGFINKSLSALGNVMEALDRKASHVPYRDSKLTYLLQDSLGGNSRTMMVVTICPMDNSYDESVHALQFATRVRRIQIGAAQRNVTSKNLEETVKNLTDEMRALARAKERTESQLHSLKRDNTRVQEKLQNLSKSKSQNRTDSKTLEVLRKNNDDMAARWEKEKKAREETAEELENARKELRTLQQNFGKAMSKMKLLEEKLQEKEQELEQAAKKLRHERNEKAAANVRARRDQVLNTRKIQIESPPAPTKDSGSSPPTPLVPDAGGEISIEDSHSNSKDESHIDDVAEIRSRVLALLEIHDKGKVNRIDIIMEKFKGKEALLLEKMSQRYEGDASGPAPISVQKRNEMALERHRERMQKIREKKQQNGSGP